jgi:hypothetical protein
MNHPKVQYINFGNTSTIYSNAFSAFLCSRYVDLWANVLRAMYLWALWCVVAGIATEVKTQKIGFGGYSRTTYLLTEMSEQARGTGQSSSF